MKEAIHMTNRARPLLATKNVNIDLVCFLLLYHVIISNVQIWFSYQEF